jgi:hypothetical protein
MRSFDNNNNNTTSMPTPSAPEFTNNNVNTASQQSTAATEDFGLGIFQTALDKLFSCFSLENIAKSFIGKLGNLPKDARNDCIESLMNNILTPLMLDRPVKSEAFKSTCQTALSSTFKDNPVIQAVNGLVSGFKSFISNLFSFAKIFMDSFKVIAGFLGVDSKNILGQVGEVLQPAVSASARSI